MENSTALVAAMASKCRDIIHNSNEQVSTLPDALHPKHLLWMCERIQNNLEGFSAEKQHRWLGFIQAAILANQMLDLAQIKNMFNEVKRSLNIGSDQDLIDHLDVDNSFNLDLGGQG